MAPYAQTSAEQGSHTEQASKNGHFNPPCSMLRVEGTDIVDATGTPIILKGAGLGGHLNMVNSPTYNKSIKEG